MTELRFRITPGIVSNQLLEKAYFASWGRSPRPTKVQLNGNELIVRSNVKGSGTLHVLWPHRHWGLNIESTDSLLSGFKPYYLVRELTRGALGRLQKKLFEWQILGFRVPEEIRDRTRTIAQRYSRSVVADPSAPAIEQEFVEILDHLGQLSLESSRLFTEQSLAWRTRNDEKLPMFFGVETASQSFNTVYEFDLYANFLQEAFQAVLPMPSWRELEPEPNVFRWDLLEERITIPARYGFKIVIGPLLSFNVSSFPGWLASRLGEDGFFESRVTRFVNAISERYGSTVDYWILANRFNSYHINEIPIPRAVTLVRLLAQQLRSRGLDKPILIGIDQPWGEYALQHVPEYDQIQIAESLMGCHEIDAFLMELNFGLGVHSTLPRDPMSVGNMIDQWSFLGKKVFVSLSVPSAVSDIADDLDKSIAAELRWSEGLQQYWTESLVMTLLGKRMVQGIFWTPLKDTASAVPGDTKTLDPYAAPSSGLIDASNTLKMAFKQFASIKKTYLK